MSEHAFAAGRVPAIASLRLFVVAVIAASCTPGTPSINRVQPNVIARDALEGGEWYYLQTVIDSPYSASYTFVGEQGSTDRIRWEVTEDFLIARRTYEYIEGAEGVGISGAAEQGATVAMYAIEKHFDIRRQYNPTTGEELNVIEENDVDRPWQQRDFMRVDWSRNLITDNGFLVGARLFDGIEMEPVSYFIEPGTGHPHEPKFVHDEGSDGEGPLAYMDIVNRMLVRPTTAYLDGFGEIPTCFLLGEGHLDCAPAEITVRNSFLRVDPARDYEPAQYTGDRQERFGYFLTDRVGHDPEYGVVESARLRLINRHNLWEQSHVPSSATEAEIAEGAPRYEQCVADSDCRSGRCDRLFGRLQELRDRAGQAVGACTIPYRERIVRPIAYHLSRNFPEDLIGDAFDVASNWNETFVQTVGSLRALECEAAGGSGCEQERLREDAQEGFVVCRNPVTVEDHPACGEVGTSAEIGDLRYHMLGWVSDPHASSPLGYGPSSADPETGEIIMANAFIYGAALETLQSFARDIVGLLNGDVSEEQIASGDVVRAWVEDRQAPGAGAPTGRDVGRFNDAMDFSWVRSSGEGTPASVAEFLRRTEESQRHQHRAGVLGQRGGLADARLQNLRGTDIERLLTGPEMRLAAGIDPTLELGDEATLEAASPLRGMSLSRLRAIEEAHARMHESGHCVVHAEFADEGLLGLARAIARATERGDGTLEWYGRTYRLTGEDGALDYAAVRDMLRHPIFHGVTAHEIGHTLGLRHNFSGSHDALNYQPRYWELRDDGSMAPRAYDPITDEEIDGRIAEYQYSTVMDYGNNFVVTDAHGVGHYDHAAIKMGYGDLVEVFTDAPEPAEIAWWGWIQQAGWPVPLKVSSFTGGRPSAYQYTDWPIEMGGREALQARADVPYTSLQADGFLASQGIGDAVVDPEGRPMVPYMFCTDHQADLGPDCQRYDAGADAYEAVLSIIDSYWNYYVFNAFGRGRVGFTVDSYASRVHGRYFEKLKRANQIYALYRGVFEDIFGEAGTANFMVAEDGFGAWTTAVGSAFELLTRVVANPEPGNYIESLRPDGSPAYQAGSSLFALEVDPFEGRGLETRWDQDEGFFWFENLERVGYYYDKSLALQVLLDPQTNFLGRDTAADVRRYQLSFYTTFGPSTEGLIGGLMGSDWSAIAPRFDADALRYPTALELRERLPIEGTPIDPNTSFSIQLAAATYGMALIPETYDRSFFQRARVWLRNGPEGVEPAEGTPVVEFTNPSTGLIYVAASYPDASGEETGAGARMIRHAQRLAATGQFDALTDFVDNLDIVRRLSWRLEFGD